MVCDQVLLLCFASAYVQCVHVHCQIAHSDQWLSFKDWNGFAFGTVKGRIKVSAWLFSSYVNFDEFVHSK